MTRFSGISIFLSTVALGLFVFCEDNLAQVNLTSSNLPIIIIDTNDKSIVDEPKITAKMKVIYNGNGTLNEVNTDAYHYDGFIGIEIRGSSAQNFPKKSYTIETRDSLGNNLNFPLLDLPEENDWVLYAPYSDKTLLRNVLAYRLASEMGNYAPRTKFCEVILNNNYAGVYVLTDKIKKDDNRIDISTLRESDTSGVQLTGGYVIQIDRNDGSGWYSDFPPFEGADQRVYYQIVYPDNDDIQLPQFDYIYNSTTNFESVMTKENYDDPVAGFPGIIDVYSLIDYMIISELSKNVDAYRLSTYLYKDRDDKDKRFHFGPIWDYNLAFGNVDYYGGQFLDNWYVNLDNKDTNPPPFWFKKLFNSSLVFNKFCSRWAELRRNELSLNHIFDIIDNNVDQLNDATKRNFQKWDILGIKIWPNPNINFTYEREISYLKNWVEKRIEWIDENVDKDFSQIEWKQKKEVYTSTPHFTLSSQSLYTSKQKVDNIEFIPFSDNIEVTNTRDSVKILTGASEGETILGVGYYQGKLVEISPLYEIKYSVTSVEDSEQQPDRFTLNQNYPNPFNPVTTIEYTIPAGINHRSTGSKVTLKVYDILGSEIVTLVNEQKNPGKYKIEFNAENLNSGVYFYRLSTGYHSIVRKMSLIK